MTEGSPLANDWLKRHYERTGAIQRSTPDHPAKPQVLTPPSPESVDQAAVAIVMEFGTDSQRHLIDIGRQITGLVEAKRTEEWRQYVENVDLR
jgi:hypothetical protein